MKKLILFLIVGINIFADTFDFYHDNDVFITDEYYTSGFEFKYRHNSTKEIENYYNFMFGQKFYTPSNTTEIEVNKYDRPYAAWLYLGYEKEKRENHREKLYGFLIGITGPNALGELMQESLHGVIGEEIPNGWKTQIEEILGFQYYYSLISEEYLKKDGENSISRQNHFSYEIGNIFTNIKYGKIFLIGNKTPFEENQKELSYYFYVEPSLQLTLYDATLKGAIYNTKSEITKDYYNVLVKNTLGTEIQYKDFIFNYSLNFNSTELKDISWKLANHIYSKFFIRVDF